MFSSCLLHVDRKVFWKNVLLSTVCAMFDVFLKNIGNCKRGKFSDGFGGNYVSCHQNDCRAIGPSLSFPTFPPISLDFLNLFFFGQHISPGIRKITKVELSKIDRATTDPGTVECSGKVCGERSRSDGCAIVSCPRWPKTSDQILFDDHFLIKLIWPAVFSSQQFLAQPWIR